MSKTFTTVSQPTLRLSKPSQSIMTGTSSKAKRSMTQTPQGFKSREPPLDQKDDDKGDLPERMKEYTRGEQIDQYTVYMKPSKVKGNTVCRWFAFRSAGADTIYFHELILNFSKVEDGNYRLILNRRLIKERGLGFNKIRNMLEYIRKLGWGVNIPQNPNFTSVIITGPSNIDLIDELRNDPGAKLTVGGVSLLWGDFYPFYESTYFDQLLKANTMCDQVVKYTEFVRTKRLIVSPKGVVIDDPKFGCLPRAGVMKLRGGCNSAGHFTNIIALKKKFQGFYPIFNYMPDVNVLSKINEYLNPEDQQKLAPKGYQPVSNEFSFDFKTNMSQHKLPFLLVCDMMYSFYKLIESTPEAKLALRDNPISCSDITTCLPYYSENDLKIMDKIKDLLDIKQFEIIDVERETQNGKRCRLQIFGSDDEDEQWKELNPDIEYDWYYQQSKASKNVRLSPRTIKKNDQVMPYEEAIKNLVEVEKKEIAEARRAQVRKLRGYE